MEGTSGAAECIVFRGTAQEAALKSTTPKASGSGRMRTSAPSLSVRDADTWMDVSKPSAAQDAT
jgi:hypothetical protein